ncbi:flavin oxidoreductase [Prochlorococcus marinus XMU1411]|uniref:diflavin flavoprotein n=1 Tax=Prochlorococcus marinus TaxID=1219 RepID=UPI001ADD1B76|nr:diflavin flavoprotein [Prochlorococcus marinus]MBO8242913.1 flavin oxidoreductase [Prochlorococcus marinus XMU1411]MBW3054031.1 flavin oxidoreductase [Prochlorococcus marinus str. MU1411]MCR8537602.1 diflavin flavoprotein [Prochlorococcus marinus CUG1430]
MSVINTSLISQNQNLLEFEITENITCIRFLDQNKERFELEFNLEKGTSFNTFLIRSKDDLFIIHPPEKQNLDAFNKKICDLFNQFKFQKINIISGHINPQVIETIKNISARFQNLTITCSNPGFKLINELWNQKNPNLKNNIDIQLPKINIIKKELKLELDNILLELIPIPTARWPGGLIVYERNQEILISEKFFSAHIAAEYWSETNRVSTEIDRKHFYDCLMAPMSNQVVTITEKIAEYEIKTIAPLHGPAIEYSLKSFLNDYIRWGENLSTNNPRIALIYASAYGNTASIGDALAKGINRTSVEVQSINCEFTPNDVLIKSIQNADGYLIGSPTLGGHAPTPIVSALGTLLSEGNRDKPVGIFGSFGWSGEAIDLLESKLKDGGFKFSFDPIRIKFSPDKPKIKELEEIGTHFGRKIIKQTKIKTRKTDTGMISSKTDPKLQALGRIIGSLCVLTASKGKNENNIKGAMLASWVSQASFSPPGLSIAVAKDRSVESLLQIGDLFALNILSEKDYKEPLKRFTKPFAPGEDRFKGLDIELTPNEQIIIPESLAWLDASVKERMECGDHWVIYAEVLHGNILKSDILTAVHHRKTGANY